MIQWSHAEKVVGQRDGDLGGGGVGGGGESDATCSFIRPFTPVAKATCLQGTGEMHNHGQNNRQGGTEREETINTTNEGGGEEEEGGSRSAADVSSPKDGGV